MSKSPAKSPDVLSELALAFRLEGSMGDRVSLRAPWGFRLPKSDVAALLVVVRGRVHFELLGESGRTLELGPGDVVAIPHGDAHAIADDPKTPLEDITCGVPSRGDSVERHRGGQTELLLLACRFREVQNNPLLRALPPLLHYAGHDGAVVGWLDPTVRLLAAESAGDEPGRTMVLDRLAEVAFLQLIRTWLENEHECRGWLRALKDSRIAQALSVMHNEPEQPWSIATLAARVGMSRSTFAAQFRELVGETPLDYLTRWRMQRAARMLRAGEAPLKEVVARSGYASEAAFRAAFRKWIGSSPGALRPGKAAPVVVAASA